MYLLLIAATRAEIQPSIDFLEKNKIPSLVVEVVITGVGAVATSYAITSSINHPRPNLLIQAGISGSFGDDDKGHVMAISEDAFADLGVWENDRFNTVFDLGLTDDNAPPFKNRSLVNPHQKLLEFTGLPKARAITVNEITTDPARIAWYRQELTPSVEGMEGAAFHYVCLLEDILFLQLRAVSNKVGERDKTKWNMQQAINNLNEKLILLLNELSKYDETYFRI